MKRLGLAIWNSLLRLQKWFMIVAGSAVVLLVFIQVLLRYVFGSPLFGIEELVCLIAMWLYFIGASYGAYERSHIKADLMHLWFRTPRSLAFANSVSSAVTLLLAAVMVHWSYPYFVWGIKRGETSQALLLPMVLSQSAVFFGAILMCFYFLVEFVDHLLETMGKRPPFRPLSEKEP
jgi:TRAP-type transport system small permease protein